MLGNTYYLHQIKRTNGVIEKGIVVKDSAETAKGNLDAAQQSMYAYPRLIIICVRAFPFS